MRKAWPVLILATVVGLPPTVEANNHGTSGGVHPSHAATGNHPGNHPGTSGGVTVRVNVNGHVSSVMPFGSSFGNSRPTKQSVAKTNGNSVTRQPKTNGNSVTSQPKTNGNSITSQPKTTTPQSTKVPTSVAVNTKSLGTPAHKSPSSTKNLAERREKVIAEIKHDLKELVKAEKFLEDRRHFKDDHHPEHRHHPHHDDGLHSSTHGGVNGGTGSNTGSMPSTNPMSGIMNPMSGAMNAMSGTTNPTGSNPGSAPMTSNNPSTATSNTNTEEEESTASTTTDVDSQESGLFNVRGLLNLKSPKQQPTPQPNKGSRVVEATFVSAETTEPVHGQAAAKQETNVAQAENETPVTTPDNRQTIAPPSQEKAPSLPVIPSLAGLFTFGAMVAVGWKKFR